MPILSSLRRQKITSRAAALLAVLLAAFSGDAHAQQNSTLDQQVLSTIRKCQRMSTSCASEVQSGVGVLVFPSVVKADLIVGGSGGQGALIEHNRITGYYSLGSGSIGLQAGYNKASQVYVFRTQQALANLKNGPDWKAGASAGVTLVAATQANSSSVTGDVLAYVFNSHGLNGGVSLDGLDIWKTGDKRP